MLWFIVSSLFMSASALLVYFYYMRKGQFDEAEDVKYQIFRDDENSIK